MLLGGGEATVAFALPQEPKAAAAAAAAAFVPL